MKITASEMRERIDKLTLNLPIKVDWVGFDAIQGDFVEPLSANLATNVSEEGNHLDVEFMKSLSNCEFLN